MNGPLCMCGNGCWILHVGQNVRMPARQKKSLFYSNTIVATLFPTSKASLDVRTLRLNRGRLFAANVLKARACKSAHWGQWLGGERRCVVPFTRMGYSPFAATGLVRARRIAPTCLLRRRLDAVDFRAQGARGRNDELVFRLLINDYDLCHN